MVSMCSPSGSMFGWWPNYSAKLIYDLFTLTSLPFFFCQSELDGVTVWVANTLNTQFHIVAMCLLHRLGEEFSLNAGCRIHIHASAFIRSHSLAHCWQKWRKRYKIQFAVLAANRVSLSGLQHWNVTRFQITKLDVFVIAAATVLSTLINKI